MCMCVCQAVSPLLRFHFTPSVGLMTQWLSRLVLCLPYGPVNPCPFFVSSLIKIIIFSDFSNTLDPHHISYKGSILLWHIQQAATA